MKPFRLAFIGSAVIITAAAVVVVAWSKPAANHLVASPAPARTPTMEPTPKATQILDPLQIPAIRARTYPTSFLTAVKDLGEQTGYHNTIASFVSDGLSEYALISTPDAVAPTGGWPVIILAHGYIDPAAYQTAGSDYAAIIGALARAGYVVIKPDFRGHASSQGSPAGGHFSPVYAYDVLNLLASLKSYAPVNASRIGLLGHSMGGHTALRVAVTSPAIKATVIMSGVVGSFNDLFYSWPNSPMAKDQPAALVQGGRAALIAKYGTPQTNPSFWDSASAVNFVSGISGAVQIDQSISDSTVPKLFSDHLDQALTAVGKTPEYFLYPGDDHQLSLSQALFIERIIAFYRAHL